jgi:hypothetical protein
MNVLPANQQESLLLDHKAHGAADIAAAHAIGLNQHRRTMNAQEIDLCLAVTEDVDMGW